jgi:putative ABC transport system substrate-binding protein
VKHPLLVICAAAAVSGAAVAQPAGRIPQVGFLAADCVMSPRDQGFFDGLGQLGYAVGKDIIVDRLCFRTEAEARSRLKEFVARPVTVLFVTGPGSARLAMAATRDIPIVCGSCGDPIQTGLATSLSRPGGNLTGLASLSVELIAKRLELIREALPQVTRVAILSNPQNPGTPLTQSALASAAQATGIAIQRVDFRGIGDFAAAFDAAARARADAVLLADDPYAYTAREEIGRQALHHRLPTIAGEVKYAEVGCFIAYGPNRYDLFHRAAAYVDKILKGAKPGDLPIELPTRFELVINLKTAKALGMALPASLLARADALIE